MWHVSIRYRERRSTNFENPTKGRSRILGFQAETKQSEVNAMSTKINLDRYGEWQDLHHGASKPTSNGIPNTHNPRLKSRRSSRPRSNKRCKCNLGRSETTITGKASLGCRISPRSTRFHLGPQVHSERCLGYPTEFKGNRHKRPTNPNVKLAAKNEAMGITVLWGTERAIQMVTFLVTMALANEKGRR